MVEYVAQALKQTSREATILLYSPALETRARGIYRSYLNILAASRVALSVGSRTRLASRRAAWRRTTALLMAPGRCRGSRA